MPGKSTHAKSTRPKHGGNRGKSSPDTISARQRQTEALRMRQEGRTFQEIADTLGYSDRSGAYVATMAALTETTTEPNNEMRSLELGRLDELQAGLWKKATGGDVQAVDRVLKVMERRAKIVGLDAAPKLPTGELDELIQRELDRIAGLEAAV